MAELLMPRRLHQEMAEGQLKQLRIFSRLFSSQTSSPHAVASRERRILLTFRNPRLRARANFRTESILLQPELKACLQAGQSVAGQIVADGPGVRVIR